MSHKPMDVFSELLNEATSDPTRNPWLFLSEKIRRTYYPPTPEVTVKQLYFIAALLGVYVSSPHSSPFAFDS